MAYKPVKRAAGQGSARPQRLFQILSILWEAEQEPMFNYEHDGWLTSGQIAKEMHLTTSPHFREMLDQLYGDGCIEVRAEYYRKNMQIYLWRIRDGARFSASWKSAFDAWLEPEKELS